MFVNNKWALVYKSNSGQFRLAFLFSSFIEIPVLKFEKTQYRKFKKTICAGNEESVTSVWSQQEGRRRNVQSDTAALNRSIQRHSSTARKIDALETDSDCWVLFAGEKRGESGSELKEEKLFGVDWRCCTSVITLPQIGYPHVGSR